MRRGKAPILGGLVLLVCALAYALALLAFFMSGATLGQQLTTLAQLAGFFAFPAVGSLIVSRRPSNTIGWIFCAIGLGTATTAFSAGYVTHALTTHADTQLATGIVDALGNGIWSLNIGLGTLLLLLFPDGKPLSRWWRVIVEFAIAVIATAALADLTRPGPLETGGRVVNPLGITSLHSVVDAVDLVAHLILPPLVVLAIASVIVRYRRATGIQRQQIKWFAFGAASMAAIICVTTIAFSDQNSVPSTIGFSVAFALLPIGAGTGVLRYRLYDIDILINRTLVYGSLTAVLAAVYFGCVVGLQHLAAVLAGRQTSDNPLIIVVSTLLIAALFQPLRRRIQRGIDHRFYRRKYDATKTLERFAMALRSETDLAELTAHVVATVEETMQPSQAWLWLRESGPSFPPKHEWLGGEPT